MARSFHRYPKSHHKFRFGSDKLKREFLAPSISGDFVSCIGVSEVGGGSDVASKSIYLYSFIYAFVQFAKYLSLCCIFVSLYSYYLVGVKTTAVKKDGDYIINGGKMWITNGAQADWMCLLANTSDGPAHRNKSLICLPMNLPGMMSFVPM